MSTHIFVGRGKHTEEMLGIGFLLAGSLKDRTNHDSRVKVHPLSHDPNSMALELAQTDINPEDDVVLAGTPGVGDHGGIVDESLLRALDLTEARQALSRAKGVYLALTQSENPISKDGFAEIVSQTPKGTRGLNIGELPAGIFGRLLNTLTGQDIRIQNGPNQLRSDDIDKLRSTIFNPGDAINGMKAIAERILGFVDSLATVRN